jgi:nicotinate-nucleotide adenylyltransferase
MKIGILGGTFNPIHHGHLRAAEEIQDVFGFDKVIFIPTGKPAFKKSGLISARHRYEMTKIAINENPDFDISDIEIKNRGTSYSVDTITKLTDNIKNAEFFFILGIDAFLDLPKWKDPLRLMELTNFVIISRPGYSFVDLLSSPYLLNVRKETLVKIDRGKKKKSALTLSSGKKAFLCKVAELNISASRIRSLIKSGKSIKYLLPETVESYIISHKLYIHNT